MSEDDTRLAMMEFSILIVMAVSLVLVAYYINPIVACLTVATESVIAVRFLDGDDNGGCFMIVIVSLFMAFALTVMWLVMKVNGV